MKLCILLLLMLICTSCSNQAANFSSTSNSIESSSESIESSSEQISIIGDISPQPSLETTSQPSVTEEPRTAPSGNLIDSSYFKDLDSLYNEIYTAKSGTDMINGDTPIKLYELKGIPSNFTLHGIELSAEQYYTATYYSDKGTKFVFKKVNEQQAESYWKGFGDNYEMLSNNSLISNIRLTETETEYGIMEEILYDTKAGKDFYASYLSFELDNIRYIWNTSISARDGTIAGRWIVFNDDLSYIVRHEGDSIPFEVLQSLELLPYTPSSVN